MGLNLELRVGRPWSGLGGAYARGEPAALRWFGGGDWRSPDAWRARAREVAADFDTDARARAVGMLRAPAEATRLKLARVAKGDGFLVTTGQQPGLFTGPGYTLLKALSAIVLARWLESLLDAPVVPVFWVASEDHDWAEVDHVHVVGVDNELHRITLPPPAGAGDLPIHRLVLGTGVEQALDDLTQLLPTTEFTASYLDLLHEAWQPTGTLNQGVQDTLAFLLGDLGVAFVDAADMALKEASVPLLEAEAVSASRHEQGVARRAAELQAAGWEPQVPVLEGGVNLFVESPAGRERLYRDGDGFRLRKSGAPLALDDFLARLRSDPGTVSPNVLLRPVVEASLLPTLGYVAGPGETAYSAQLAPLFASHGVRQPLLFPRFSATLVEGKVAKVLDKLELSVEDLARPAHEIFGDFAREQMPEPVLRALEALRDALDRGSAALTEAARPIDPTLKGPIQRARSVAVDALGEAERKILQAVKRQNETRLQQVEKARVHLFPGGTPQERVTSPFYFLARYGPELLDGILERFGEELPAPSPAGSLAPPSGPR